MLRQNIMSSFISSLTENLFKFATWLHFITNINVGVFKLIYFVIFFIFGVLSLFVLRKNVAWEKC